MMTNKHTPGPWRIGATMPKMATGGHTVHVISRVQNLPEAAVFDRFYDEAIIAVVMGETRNADEDGALIAAAPDLLAVCEKILMALPTDWFNRETAKRTVEPQLCADIKNAIAKAKGQNT